MSAADLTQIAQLCYDQAKSGGRSTRAVAAEIVAMTTPALRDEMAVEFLVSIVAHEQRAATLNAERAASTTVTTQSHETPRAPRKGTKAREAWERETEIGREFARLDEEAWLRTQQMWANLSRSLDRYAEDLRVQWTVELLESTFALRDGSLVLWGDATIEQHRERQDLFLKNAHANMEGAARHEVAVRDLEASGASCLREMVELAAITRSS